MLESNHVLSHTANNCFHSHPFWACDLFSLMIITKQQTNNQAAAEAVAEEEEEEEEEEDQEEEEEEEEESGIHSHHHNHHHHQRLLPTHPCIMLSVCFWNLVLLADRLSAPGTQKLPSWLLGEWVFSVTDPDTRKKERNNKKQHQKIVFLFSVSEGRERSCPGCGFVLRSGWVGESCWWGGFAEDAKQHIVLHIWSVACLIPGWWEEVGGVERNEWSSSCWVYSERRVVVKGAKSSNQQEQPHLFVLPPCVNFAWFPSVNSFGSWNRGPENKASISIGSCTSILILGLRSFRKSEIREHPPRILGRRRTECQGFVTTKHQEQQQQRSLGQQQHPHSTAACTCLQLRVDCHGNTLRIWEVCNRWCPSERRSRRCRSCPTDTRQQLDPRINSSNNSTINSSSSSSRRLGCHRRRHEEEVAEILVRNPPNSCCSTTAAGWVWPPPTPPPPAASEAARATIWQLWCTTSSRTTPAISSITAAATAIADHPASNSVKICR